MLASPNEKKGWVKAEYVTSSHLLIQAKKKKHQAGKLHKCFKFYLNTTNILRTPVELQLLARLTARLTGGSSALYNRHAVWAPKRFNALTTATTAWDKQIQTHKHVQFNVCTCSSRSAHTRAHAPMEWWRRGGICIITQSYLSNYRWCWHWSISLLWWARDQQQLHAG